MVVLKNGLELQRKRSGECLGEKKVVLEGMKVCWVVNVAAAIARK